MQPAGGGHQRVLRSRAGRSRSRAASEQERGRARARARSRLKVVAQRITFLPGAGGTAPDAEPYPAWMAEVLSYEPGH